MHLINVKQVIIHVYGIFQKIHQEKKMKVYGYVERMIQHERKWRRTGKINNELLVSEAEYSGDVTKADGLVEDKFIYKIGARVVITANDSAGEYNNGSLGTITGTNGIGSGLFTSVITVKLDNGHTVMIEKKESDKYKYEAVEEEKRLK